MPESEIVLQGKGVHTGLPCGIRFQRRNDDGGIRFFWPGWANPLAPEDLGSLQLLVRRSTILEGPEGQKIRTPEHLLAACLFFADVPLDIFCDSSEPPGLDGSSLPFYNALSRIFPEAAKAPQWSEYSSNLDWTYEGPEGSLRASPANSFSVDYTWDKPPLQERVAVETPSDTVNEILPARTFILHREWLAAKGAADLLVGANEDSGLLLAESREEFEAACRNHPEFEGRNFPLLHPQIFRMEQEPVRHKILDLLGDLALLGLVLPRLRLEISNGGHALNHLLLEQLLHERLEQL